ELRTVVRGEVDDSPEVREKASRDASLFVVKPEVVVSPEDADDVCALVKFVNAKKAADPDAHISLTARSAGTDMSGGPLTDSIVLSMTPHFNRIISVTDGEAIVEPGVYFRDFDKATKEHGLELPSYTASREINTVGGMVANDSGGEKNLKYGKTDRYIRSLDVVLSDGGIHTLKKLEGDELVAKMKELSFEGDLYRRISKLLNANAAVIERARPVVSKNSSGYALWDIGDGVRSIDLARLMCGAQGTLGIVTKIDLSLVRPKQYSAMTVIMLKDMNDLGAIIKYVLRYDPDSFESYDDNTFKLALKYFPEFAAQMKANLLTLGISFIPDVWMVATGGIPKLILLVEFRADTQEEATSRAEKLAAEIHIERPRIRVRVAPNEKASRKYWTVRRESFNLLRKKMRSMRTAPFIDDFVVPPESLPEFLPKLRTILDEYDLFETVAGHVGDGNFHIIPLIDPRQPDIPHIVDELSHRVYDLVLSYHGSITGEHNDGLIRTPYVEKMFGSEMANLFREIKQIFDPHDIFNPGKKVGGTWQAAMQHLDLQK
ncbi:MAG TPA: FAD-binding oxidoreductase, partial [Candidatus Paceibacterota bacterium]